MPKCYLTGVDYERVQTQRDAIEYDIHIDNVIHRMSFHSDHKNSNVVDDNLYIIKGLLVNKKWKPNGSIITNEFLENLIRSSYYPRSPKEKKDKLLLTIHGRQKYEGHEIELSGTDEIKLITQCYMKNWEEVLFYLNTLREEELLRFNGKHTQSGFNLGTIKFTFKGLEYLISLDEAGQFSKNCFIAMSFSESAKDIRQVLKDVVIEAGYYPILVDEINYDSDVTINDAIISQIKKCKFLIADFTDQKHGVYFEAGYASGLKRPVIYTCSKEDFKKSHFDTNHYPHIVYSKLEDLAHGLKNKIGAWID